MQLVALLAHVYDIHAATSSANFVFTSTLGLMQFEVAVLTAFIQAESSPEGIPAQVP